MLVPRQGRPTLCSWGTKAHRAVQHTNRLRFCVLDLPKFEFKRVGLNELTAENWAMMHDPIDVLASAGITVETG